MIRSHNLSMSVHCKLKAPPGVLHRPERMTQDQPAQVARGNQEKEAGTFSSQPDCPFFRKSCAGPFERDDDISPHSCSADQRPLRAVRRLSFPSTAGHRSGVGF